MEGEFELSKSIEYNFHTDSNQGFDMKEFLPQTKHKYHLTNKNVRFMKSVVEFKKR